MFCRNCGKKLNDADKFCSRCGKGTETAPANNNYMNSGSVAAAPKAKKKKRPVLIAFVIVISLMLGMVSSFFAAAFMMGIAEAFKEDSSQISQSATQETEQEDDAKATEAEETNEEEYIEGKDAPQGEETPGFWDSVISAAQSEGTGETQRIPLLTFTLSFNDMKMFLDSEEWYEYLYEEGYYGLGSMDDYYMECSKGMLTFVPAKETWESQSDGIIDLELDMKHPHFNYDRGDELYFSEAFDFFSYVLEMTDEYVDYASYDTDGNGYLKPQELTIMFIFSGYEEYSDFDYSATTYSSSIIFEGYLNIDDVYIDECIFTAEKDPYNGGEGQIAGVGIICHELGHAIDLPDLYDTDYTSEGLAFHCLMAGGCENTIGFEAYSTLPAPLIAWERVYLGFEVPEDVTEDGVYTVYARSTDKYNILKITDGDGYYLIENVDYEGFGKGLQGFLKSPGVAIWYVNKAVVTSPIRMAANTINDNEKKYGVKLLEANDTEELSSGEFDYLKVYDHYYYLTGDNLYEADNGLKIEILDYPDDEMRVKVTFP